MISAVKILLLVDNEDSYSKEEISRLAEIIELWYGNVEIQPGKRCYR